MGKYMKKSKITGDIAAMEMSPQTSHGVRTRAAKTLALQRLASRPTASSCSYLQLRSRRLEKAPWPQQKAQHLIECCRGRSTLENSRSSSRLKQDSAHSELVGASASLKIEEELEKQSPGIEVENGDGLDFKASFCEDSRHFGVENGSSAENTSFSLARESNTLETPDLIWNSMTSHTTDSKVEMELHRKFSISNDIEEFFACEELWHQRMFIEKYNFDFPNDTPLQGRYEWVQMVP